MESALACALILKDMLTGQNGEVLAPHKFISTLHVPQLPFQFAVALYQCNAV